MANPSVHYLGVVGIAAIQDHSRCAAQADRIKAERSNEYGPDGAYNEMVCIHGQRFVGRGWGRDSAANGVENGVNHNPGSRAICALVGTDDEITPELEQAIRDFANEAVNQHGMSWPLRPHSSYVATSCPGDRLRATIDEINADHEGDEVTPEQMATLGQWMKDVETRVIKECDLNPGDLTNISAAVWNSPTGQAVLKKLGL